MTATISPAFQRIMRNSDLTSLGSHYKYKTPETQDNSNIFLSTDGRDYFNKAEQNNAIMNLEDDDEMIEIRQDPDQIRLYKDSSRNSDQDSNYDYLRDSKLKQQQFIRIETDDYDVKSPQNTINATGIMRFSNANNNTIILQEKLNPQQMLFQKSPKNLIPLKKSKIDVKIQKLGQNETDEDYNLKDIDNEGTVNEESVTMYDARQSNSED